MCNYWYNTRDNRRAVLRHDPQSNVTVCPFCQGMAKSQQAASLAGHVMQSSEQPAASISTITSHARLAQSVERETLTSTRSQGCGFDPRIGLFL
ncbi:unnamed protein product [Fusarium graminearum]|uniref:Uncharacterized protein n=1 Tax=Gibberella zeae TaxID=5518 RepID=A0A679NG16_GIBZA|nr:unnamed protein product [Fusarium graminearum]